MLNTLNLEEFKPIVSYGFPVPNLIKPNTYMVNEHGDVISLNRQRIPYLTKYTLNGVDVVHLRTADNKPITAEVHFLVAEAFVPNPNSYIDIRFKDRKIYNCEASNLEWCGKKKPDYYKSDPENIKLLREKYGDQRFEDWADMYVNAEEALALIGYKPISHPKMYGLKYAINQYGDVLDLKGSGHLWYPRDGYTHKQWIVKEVDNKLQQVVYLSTKPHKQTQLIIPVAELVAITFLPSPDEDSMDDYILDDYTVEFIDGDVDHIEVSNLRWVKRIKPEIKKPAQPVEKYPNWEEEMKLLIKGGHLDHQILSLFGVSVKIQNEKYKLWRKRLSAVKKSLKEEK